MTKAFRTLDDIGDIAGKRVLVLGGVAPGARIVTQGAELLGQVR